MDKLNTSIDITKTVGCSPNEGIVYTFTKSMASKTKT